MTESFGYECAVANVGVVQVLRGVDAAVVLCFSSIIDAFGYISLTVISLRLKALNVIVIEAGPLLRC